MTEIPTREAARGRFSTPLIGAEPLAATLGGVTVLDVRWQLGGPSAHPQYLEGHIPGAAFVDLDDALSGPPGPRGRHPLPDGEAFTSAMRSAGVSSDRPVVVYDAANSMAAARAWWVLRYYGHPEVAVLDGGLAGWVAAGLPLEAGGLKPLSGDFQATPGHMPVLDAEGAGELARSGVLLDARAPERFRGEHEPVDPVGGHIPGAHNWPTNQNVDDRGRFRDADALRQEFDALGVATDTPVGAYCGSGVAAAHEVLALELAGFAAALYVGSWSEWITDPERPVAAGPDPE